MHIVDSCSGALSYVFSFGFLFSVMLLSKRDKETNMKWLFSEGMIIALVRRCPISMIVI